MAKSTTASTDTSSSNVTVEDLSSQLEILKKDIAALTNSLGDYGKTKSQEVTRQAKDAVNDATTAGRVRALEAQASAEEFIRTQPATALGIAAGVGFLVGIVTARR
ncbi:MULTISPECIES: DUF883 family protein [unclassified Sulfitobacter]|mgnify:CR=1 FL=1|uniref:DUF883 family protein n=1 Tax=unclassified Sulfitobacter TaxID=196795 RepID=UPI0007C3C37C|nr:MULTISPECIES: DUF883 family protein [unclassified Sulfitobacter]KZY00002.1 hypothetical protein A3721_05410 [Sulfitobacter sp. HI0023]KZY22373.1 hypothetical protein A3728_10830 [Sulfitobacter sp. HI0040]KZZ64304.1 hypothetical protein A3764_04735 [Sulfitobacter sp. HI0129]